jgi:hypothetical protein
MNSALARILVRLYPCAWRDRYGDEFESFLENGPGGVWAAANVIKSALRERLHRIGTFKTDQNSRSFGIVVNRPTAIVPIAMSITALTVVICHLFIYGVARETDEGAAAHIWQLLMVGQLPILAFFALRWLPRAPRQTLCVIALQVGAVLASMVPVFVFNL